MFLPDKFIADNLMHKVAEFYFQTCVNFTVQQEHSIISNICIAFSSENYSDISQLWHSWETQY